MHKLARSERRVRPGWLGGLALLLAWASAGLLGPHPPLPAAHAQAPPAPLAAVPVVVAPARAASDTLTVEAVGSARAQRTATLQPAVAGEVASVAFRAGQRVRQGQVLLTLVDHHQRLAAQMAAAELDIARRLLARYAGTEGSGAVPGSVIDQARSDQQRARITLAQAEQALADRQLRAPFDGVIGLAQVHAGDRITPDSVVGTLDDRRRLELAFPLPEPYLARVRPGHAVRATSVAYPGRHFEGRVTQIDSRIDEATRTLQLRAELPNADDLLRPGQSFNVRLSLPGASHLQLPELALQWGRDGGHVWVLRDGKADKVAVQLVRRLDGTVLVDGALQPGEPVVVEGVQRLRPGRAVLAVEAAP